MFYRDKVINALDEKRAELDQLDTEAFESQGEAFASLDPADRKALVDAVREPGPVHRRWGRLCSVKGL